MLSADDALAWASAGRCCAASGVALDLRKANPYCGYETLRRSTCRPARVGDCYDRYLVRVAEMRESVQICRQALDRLPDGPVQTGDRKVMPPPREELARSMEAVIHHFKLWTEGIRPPAGEAYVGVESPRGELGFYIVSDGSGRPIRVHERAPSFANLQALPHDDRGRRGGRRRGVHRQPGPDHGRGRPVSAARAETRSRRSNDWCATYPERRTALLPALKLAQRDAGWLPPEAIAEAADLVGVPHAAALELADFYTMLHTEPGPATRVVVCAQLPCALRGAEGLIRDLRARLAARRSTAGDDRSRAHERVLRRLPPRADGPRGRRVPREPGRRQGARR